MSKLGVIDPFIFAPCLVKKFEGYANIMPYTEVVADTGTSLRTQKCLCFFNFTDPTYLAYSSERSDNGLPAFSSRASNHKSGWGLVIFTIFNWAYLPPSSPIAKGFTCTAFADQRKSNEGGG
ncbi:hypothetical protein WN944_008512 [Citrus x changshan-huyou]|uniref:Uncharacterized protein n=1 Tax=Citrus x changshan-huyou TaxID=2935761 RepID=A0AAP0MQH7_9ROSI